jgi:hypothetical protein
VLVALAALLVHFVGRKMQHPRVRGVLQAVVVDCFLSQPRYCSAMFDGGLAGPIIGVWTGLAIP